MSDYFYLNHSNSFSIKNIFSVNVVAFGLMILKIPQVGDLFYMWFLFNLFHVSQECLGVLDCRP